MLIPAGQFQAAALSAVAHAYFYEHHYKEAVLKEEDFHPENRAMTNDSADHSGKNI